MIDNKIYPIVIIPVVSTYDGGMRILHRDRMIEISSEQSKVIWPILKECSGHYSIEEISNKINISVETVNSIILQLIELEIIIDSRKQYLHFHKISNYPMCFCRALSKIDVLEYTNSKRYSTKAGSSLSYKAEESALNDIMIKRHSCRNFSDQPITLDQIGSICRCGYYIKNGYVPSGGALYPLKIFILVEKDQINLPRGYYEYDSETDQIICFSSNMDEERIKYCFNSEILPFGSTVQIVISADLSRQTYKYGNRGYRLTLLEAGHVAENICLFCAEQGLGSCELGGMLDEPMREELNLEDEIYPIIAIAVGNESKENNNLIDEELFLEENDLLSEYYGAKTFGKNASFFGAYAQYGVGENEIAGATSTSYSHAIFKANIEAYERKISSNARVDFLGTAGELDENKNKWLNPDLIVPLTVEQRRMCNTVNFAKDIEIQWTRGYSYKLNEDIYIPTDLVYYGHKHFKNSIYYGCSSGVAADLNEFGAEKRALTELIERDAIMRSWYTKTPPFQLDCSLLSVHSNNVIEYWKQFRREVYILDMPSDYAKVFLAIIVSDEYPCFVCGAAATVDYCEELIQSTIHKALQEAEYCLYSCLDRPDDSTIEPEQVYFPKDHGKIYHTRRYIDSLKWLWSGSVEKDLRLHKKMKLDELKRKLELCKVVLSKDSDVISVVRVLSPRLIPISFGYYNTHHKHPEIKNDCKQDLKLPHFFA